MLYLLRSYTKNGSTLKVGYAKNLENRFANYKSHNPGIELITSREGELELETKLHLYFNFLGYNEYFEEWYYEKYYNQVYDIFIKPEEEIDKLIWDDRENIYSIPTMFLNRETQPISTTIYKKLLTKFGSDLLPIDFLDNKANSCLIDTKFYLYDEKENINYFPRLLKLREDIINSIPSKQLTPDLDNRCKGFIDKFESTGIFEDRMELIYNNQDLLDIPLVQVVIPMKYQNYINMIGLDKIKALDFEEKSIKDYIISQKNLDSNREDIINLFEIGKKYTKAEIKEMLKNFYQENNIDAKPKASDLEEYFEIKSCQITNKVTGKRDHGFEILGRK